MKTITLPNDLDLENPSHIQVYEYHSQREVTKQQIVLHQHTFSFLTEGTKEVVSGSSTLKIDHSRFLMMKSGHCLMTEKLSETKNYKSILLFFPAEYLLQFIRKIQLKSTECLTPQSVHVFNNDNFIRHFVTSLSDISKLSKPVQNQLLVLKFEEIMLYIIAVYGTDFLYSFTEKSDDYTQRFIRTIESNQLTKLTLKELAFLCNMSVSTFKREFEKHYSDSPIKWFQNKRLEYAHYLINHELKNSSEIYEEIGYESLSSFIQAYKSKYGVTPKQHNNI